MTNSNSYIEAKPRESSVFLLGVKPIETNKIYLGDCMELMPQIPDKSIDMILCDLPYGILSCEWDKRLPEDKLMAEYNRIIKDNAAIVLTATCKFGTELINANRKYFRYDLVWEKSASVGHANCNRMPMRSHELILVFYKLIPVLRKEWLKIKVFEVFRLISMPTRKFYA